MRRRIRIDEACPPHRGGSSRSEKCVAAGKEPLRVVALSPQLSGAVFEPAPYGLVMPRGSALTHAVPGGGSGQRSANESVARTSASTMPGSLAAWPASGIISNEASGQARCRSHAVVAGVQAS